MRFHPISLRRLSAPVWVVILFLLSSAVSNATTTHYVVKDNPGAEAPFSSWDTAAPDIQTAIAVAPSNGWVIVGNGVYDSGAHVSADDFTNRIVVPDTLTVQSANGPEAAVIQGESGMRCAALAGSARLVGFGLTGAQDVGAVVGDGAPSTLENCWIYSNSGLRGGGARGVVLEGCVLRDNMAVLGGGGAYDCSLNNCEIVGNAAENGGGASLSFLQNCMVVSNVASDAGGGARDSSLRSCLVVHNSANQGGGAYDCDLASSTLFGNMAASSGGGTHGGELINSILHGNRVAGDEANVWMATAIQFCLTTPLPPGLGNQTGDPSFSNPDLGDFRLGIDSACIDAGTNQEWMSTAFDLAGNSRIANEIVDMGAYEFVPLPVPFPHLAFLAADGFAIGNGDAPSTAADTVWTARTGYSSPHFFRITNAGDSAVSLDSVSFEGSGSSAFSLNGFPLSVEPGASSPFSVVFLADSAQVYEATLVVAHSASNTASPFVLNLRGEGVLPSDRYVAPGNPFSAAPYTSWATAAADIQSAIAVSLADDTVWVSNGVYQSGSVAGYGDRLHRIAVTNPIVVRSVNGPDSTIIRGATGMRCAYLGENATLVGFTLTNGLDSGGIWCADKTALVSNCFLSGNTAAAGAGILDGTIRNSSIVGNHADSGGGAFNALLFDCVLASNTAELGGGAYDGELHRCDLQGNSATDSGGGAFGATLYNSVVWQNAATNGGGGTASSSLFSCLIVGNRAAQGGGSLDSFLNNCTVTDNSASLDGGGIHGGEAQNSIVYYNVGDDVSSSTLSHSCTPLPLPGPGNIDSEPLFADPAANDYNLASNSPCINFGNNNSWMDGALDLAGNFRVVGPSVDIGAFEHPFTPSGIEAGWLRDNGFPWDGSADHEDADSDAFSNWKEWRANSNPNDPLSRLALERPTVSRPSDGEGWIIQWQSSTGKQYVVERSTNLLGSPAFMPVAASIPGQAGLTVHTDRTASASTPCTYRIVLQ